MPPIWLLALAYAAIIPIAGWVFTKIPRDYDDDQIHLVGAATFFSALFWPLMMVVYGLNYGKGILVTFFKWLGTKSRYAIDCPSCSGEGRATGFGNRIAVCDTCKGSGIHYMSGSEAAQRAALEDDEDEDDDRP